MAVGETEQESAQDPLQDALRLLRSGLSTNRLHMREIDPALDNIRSDPRYADLLRRMGLPQ